MGLAAFNRARAEKQKEAQKQKKKKKVVEEPEKIEVEGATITNPISSEEPEKEEAHSPRRGRPRIG